VRKSAYLEIELLLEDSLHELPVLDRALPVGQLQTWDKSVVFEDDTSSRAISHNSQVNIVSYLF
jgi:hypothetical protein